MSFLSRAFSGEPEKRAVARLGSIPPWSEASSGGYYGGPRNAMKMVVFFRCVEILSTTVASLPIKAYRMKAADKGSIREAVSPQPLLMQSPYPDVTWYRWLMMMMYSLTVTGNAFGYVTARDGRGYPTAILPVHPDSIRVDPESSWINPEYEIDGRHVASSDVFHIQIYPTPGCPIGLSPVEHLAQTLDLGFEAESYGLRWFKQSANPSGILSTEQNLTPEQIAHTAKSWDRSHRGRRDPAILGGGLKWTSIGIPPNESQFLETRAHQRSDIAMMFGIPPHMIGDTEKSTSWGSGIAEQVLGFQKFTVNPWIVCIEQAFERILPRGQFAKFNVDALIRPDIEARYRAHQIAIQSGFASPDERRALEDLPPIEGYPGDIFLQPTNFGPLGYTPPEPSTSNPQADPGEKGNQ